VPGLSACVALSVGVALLLSGCGSVGATPSSGADPGLAELRAYVAEVEQVRLPVNNLLGDADPILAAYHDHKTSPDAASGEMGKLEERFASYMFTMESIDPASAELKRINAPYAETYFFEDSYLSALLSVHRFSRSAINESRG
jgi:hypothetical protein